MSEDIFERCKTICVEHLAVSPDKVAPTSYFIEGLGCDSLDMIELVMAAEEEFGIEISDAEAEAMLTVQQAVDTITKKLAVGLVL